MKRRMMRVQPKYIRPLSKKYLTERRLGTAFELLDDGTAVWPDGFKYPDWLNNMKGKPFSPKHLQEDQGEGLIRPPAAEIPTPERLSPNRTEQECLELFKSLREGVNLRYGNKIVQPVFVRGVIQAQSAIQYLDYLVKCKVPKGKGVVDKWIPLHLLSESK